MQSIELLQPLAHSHSIRIEHELEPVIVRGDLDRLAQVFTNLITNAIGTTARRSSYSSNFARDTHAVIEVQDNGIGIVETTYPISSNAFIKAMRHARMMPTLDQVLV